MKKIIVLISFITFAFNTYAQKKKIQELTIGDRLPDLSFNNVLNHPGGKLKLSAYKGKLIILDLLKTNCSSCIAAFPKLQALQKQFSGKIQIIVATTDTKEQWENLRKKNRLAKELTLPVILNDSILASYFPFVYTPHEVWLNVGLVVKAITGAEYIKASNIQQLLHSKEVNWTMKRDVGNYTFEHPLVQLNEDQYYNTPLYYSVLSGHRRGTNAAGKIVKDTAGHMYRQTIINMPLLIMFKQTMKEYRHKWFFDNRFVLEVKDPSRFILDTSKTYRYAWTIQNTYCYEITMPLNFTQDQFEQRLREDLELYLGLEGFEDKRKVQCYVLQKDQDAATKLISFKQPEKPRFKTTTGLEETLNLTLPVPVIDETGITGNINLPDINGNIYNPEDVRKYLAQFGLKIIKTERKLDVFVIREK